MLDSSHNTCAPKAVTPSLWSRIAHLLGRRQGGTGEKGQPETAAEPALSLLETELLACCREQEAELARLRAALDPTASGKWQPVNEQREDPQHAAEVTWEDAYWSLQAEMESLRADNEALLSEVRGRKRSQHGSKSERVRPEELLAAVRTLTQTDPEIVPKGMLEDLEQVCAEREMLRQRRKKKQEDKRRSAAEAALRQAVVKAPDCGDGDDDGGGGGGGPRGRATAKCAKGLLAEIIPLKRAGRRNACLAGLPRQDIIVPVSDSDKPCPTCREERQVFGYEDGHMLDLAPPSMRHLRNRREKRACRLHPEAGVAVAPAVERPLDQALPTALLLAFVIVAKVQDHLPLERLSGMFKRWGSRVAPSTLGDWYHAAAKLVEPLAEHLGKAVLGSKECLLTDGTYIRVIDPAATRGSTNGSLWGYTVAGVGAYFRYTPDGCYDKTRADLSARTGPTMTDGHKGYASPKTSMVPDANI